MKKILNLSQLAFIAVFFCGCYTTGLSVREKGEYNYSNMLYSIYENPSEPIHEKDVIHGPIKLAIAQVGETAAPASMIETLEHERFLVRQVVSIPAAGAKIDPTPQGQDSSDEARQQIRRMRQLARDLGADYLFVFGGTADHQTTSNFLSLFDLTIVGAYILPSQKHTAEGKASGVLMNVHTGQIAFIVNSEAKLKKIKPSYLETYNYYGTNSPTRNAVLAELRNELVDKLTVNFVNQLASLER